jgi:uncharacterized YigZ family protein
VFTILDAKMPDSYKTLKKSSEGIFKDKGSKFLAFAYPVDNEQEINQYRSELKKKYFDARHHVYAFCLGADQSVFRASDDGEPSNSSGPPVLGQIRSYGLTNILIIVVRYFGGTKLGVPGLINAYKSSAKNALENAIIIEKNVVLPLTIQFEYSLMNEVMRVLKHDGIQLINQQFDSNCVIEMRINKALFDQIFNALKNIPKLNFIPDDRTSTQSHA